MILVDTGPIVALCDPRDQRHRLALRDLERLTSERFFLCEAVLTETCFHLPHAVQRRRLREIIHGLQITPVSESVNGTVWSDVLGWLLKYHEHEPDWADGYLAVLSSRESGAKVWTYDREFRTTWRKTNGKPIPLVVKSR